MKLLKPLRYLFGLMVCLLGMLPMTSIGQIPAPNLYCVKGDTLRWDIPTVTCGPVQSYEIYYSTDYNGPYLPLETITNLTQTEYIFAGSPGGTLYYYMQTTASCSGQTALSSDTLDNASPLPVTIKSVSVAGNDISLSWTKGQSPETSAYIIYQGLGGGVVEALDTVTTLSYTDVNRKTADSAYTYYIVALDRCGGTSIFSNPHSTILLQGRVDTCAGKIVLNFTPYIGWPGPLKYTVLLSKDGGPEIIVGNPTTTGFTLDTLEENTEYCIRIKAEESNSGYQSFSNIICLHSKKSKTITSLCVEDIQDNGASNIHDVVLSTNEDIPIKGLFLQQAGTPEGVADAALTQFPITAGNGTQLVLDEDRLSYYRFVSIDACDKRVYSGTFSNMLLYATLKPGNEVDLSWNLPEWEGGSVSGFRLERISSGGNSEVIATVDATTLEYTDRLIDGKDGDQRYCYRIIADIAFECGGSTQHIALPSNTSCVEKTAGAYMANAFIVGGTFPEFMPIFYFKESIADYEMTIFDRYGGKIFSTQNPDKGWDGSKNGQELPNGVYSYYVRIQSGNGSVKELKGAVTLFR